MKIAVTGATGFIGRYIVRQLIGSGYDLRCWYRPSSNRDGLTHEAIEWVDGDLTRTESIARLIDGCDAVVHAALWKPGKTFRGGEGNVVRFAEVNLLGSLRLIQSAIDAGVERFVYLSTCAVHEIILDDRPLDESHPLWATSHYGAHKAAVEKFVHSYGFGSGFNICALRPTGVYGVTHPPQNSKWFDLIQRIVAGRDVTVDGGGKEVHASDVAHAVDLLVQADNAAGLAYNCYDRYISQFEVATIAKRISKSGSQINGQPKNPKHEIITERIRALGMNFGGTALLEQTIADLVSINCNRN